MFILCGLIVCSCSDGNMAKELEGSWYSELISESDDDTNIDYSQYYVFNCIEGDSEYDGSFIEKNVGAITGEYDDVGNISVKFESTIEGKFQVLFGNFYPNYDLSSCKVSITDVSIDSDDINSLFSFYGESIYEQARFIYNTENEAKKYYRKFLKRILLEQYKEWNDTYYEMQIKDDVLTFIHEDGNFIFHRVKNDEDSSDDSDENVPINSDEENLNSAIDNLFDEALYGDEAENCEDTDDDEMYSEKHVSEKEYNDTPDAIMTESDENSKEEVDDSDEIFQVVEQMPEFPGGMEALLAYLGKNIKYPVSAQENNIQGRSIVEIIVNKDGSISNPKIIKSLDPDCDKEAIRVIMTMPRWNPGKQRGKDVRVKYTIPVTFRLT